MEVTAFFDRLQQLVLQAWERLPLLLLTFLVGYVFIRVAMFTANGLIRVSRAKAALKDIILSVINLALWLLLAAAMLQQMGLTQLAFALSGFVAFAGLAVTAGTTAIVQDLLSGFFLAQDPDFNVGDQVRVNDVAGVIEKMDARKIRLRDDEGKLHVFPNSTFDKASWIVMKKK